MAVLLDLVARQPVIDSASKGPVVNLVGWIAMVTMILAVGTVLVSKWVIVRKLGWNDLLISLAMLFSIGQTIATSMQVNYGLGRHLTAVSASEYIKFQKAGYAANLLYIVALATAKISTIALLFALTRLDNHRKPIQAVGLVVIIWALGAFLASAFQCNLPNAWAYETGKCFDQVCNSTSSLNLVWKICQSFPISTTPSTPHLANTSLCI